MRFVPSGDDVAQLLGTRRSDVHRNAAAVVTAYVRSYVRDNGFPLDPDDDELPIDLAAVILTAAARLATNPAQLEQERAGDYYAVGGFKGWTLVELAVLHRYRRRTA